jgi:hypothetical protein
MVGGREPTKEERDDEVDAASSPCLAHARRVRGVPAGPGVNAWPHGPSAASSGCRRRPARASAGPNPKPTPSLVAARSTMASNRSRSFRTARRPPSLAVNCVTIHVQFLAGARHAAACRVALNDVLEVASRDKIVAPHARRQKYTASPWRAGAGTGLTQEAAGLGAQVVPVALELGAADAELADGREAILLLGRLGVDSKLRHRLRKGLHRPVVLVDVRLLLAHSRAGTQWGGEGEGWARSSGGGARRVGKMWGAGFLFRRSEVANPKNLVFCLCARHTSPRAPTR